MSPRVYPRKNESSLNLNELEPELALPCEPVELALPDLDCKRRWSSTLLRFSQGHGTGCSSSRRFKSSRRKPLSFTALAFTSAGQFEAASRSAESDFAVPWEGNDESSRPVLPRGRCDVLALPEPAHEGLPFAALAWRLAVKQIGTCSPKSKHSDPLKKMPMVIWSHSLEVRTYCKPNSGPPEGFAPRGPPMVKKLLTTTIGCSIRTEADILR